MADHNGERALKTRRGGRLGIDHPVTIKALAALSLADDELAQFRPFSNRLACDADAWARRGGFGERGRITKADAHRQFVAAFGGARKLNSLATYRPGGVR